MNWQNKITEPEGTRRVLSKRTTYDEVFQAVRHHIEESVPLVIKIAGELKKDNIRASAKSVYGFIRRNVKYRNDPAGIEQIALANRTLKNGYGDCDDMTILGAALVIGMGYKPNVYVVRTGLNKEWNHIFVTIGNNPHPDDNRIKGYVIDPVPPLTQFNELCTNIIDVINIMELHSLRGIEDIQLFEGISGIAPMTPITKKCIEREKLILENLKNENSPIRKIKWGKEFRKNRCLMAMNGMPEQSTVLGMMAHIDTVDDHGRFRLKPNAPTDDIAGYLEAENDLNLLTGNIGLLKRKNKSNKLPNARTQTRQEKRKKKKELKQQAGQGKTKAGKIIHALTKVNPLTLAARNGAFAILKMNLFHLGSKLAKGYLTESEAQAQGLNMTEWRKLKEAMPKIEKVFYAIGAEPANLKKHILQGAAKGAKRGIKGVDETSLLAGLYGIEDNDLSMLSGGLGNPAMLLSAAQIIGPIVATAVVEKLRQNKTAKKGGLKGGIGEPTVGAVLAAASGILAAIAEITKNIDFKGMTANTDEPLDNEHQNYKDEKAATGGGLFKNIVKSVSAISNQVKNILPVKSMDDTEDTRAAVEASVSDANASASDTKTDDDGISYGMIGIGIAILGTGAYLFSGKSKGGKKRK